MTLQAPEPLTKLEAVVAVLKDVGQDDPDVRDLVDFLTAYLEPIYTHFYKQVTFKEGAVILHNVFEWEVPWLIKACEVLGYSWTLRNGGSFRRRNNDNGKPRAG